MRIFILLLLFLPIYSSAQFQPQTSPTQPHVLVINTKPAPNHNGCLSAGQQCVDYSQYGNVSQTELFNSYCGFDGYFIY